MERGRGEILPDIGGLAMVAETAAQIVALVAMEANLKYMYSSSRMSSSSRATIRALRGFLVGASSGAREMVYVARADIVYQAGDYRRGSQQAEMKGE